MPSTPPPSSWPEPRSSRPMVDEDARPTLPAPALSTTLAEEMVLAAVVEGEEPPTLRSPGASQEMAAVMMEKKDES